MKNQKAHNSIDRMCIYAMRMVTPVRKCRTAVGGNIAARHVLRLDGLHRKTILIGTHPSSANLSKIRYCHSIMKEYCANFCARADPTYPTSAYLTKAVGFRQAMGRDTYVQTSKTLMGNVLSQTNPIDRSFML